jgi:hypothetical protein
MPFFGVCLMIFLILNLTKNAENHPAPMPRPGTFLLF